MLHYFSHKGHTCGCFCWSAAGQKDASPASICNASVLPRQHSTQNLLRLCRASAHTFFLSFFFFLLAKITAGPSESWCRNLCTENTVWWYCWYYRRPLSSITHCSSSHSASSTFQSAADWFPSDALASPCCSFIYALTQTRYALKMIQHAGGGVLRVACLPRGLESCRYGGAVGVTFSELGPDSSGDRSSMPSEAMSLTVRNDGVAPGCTEFSLSTEEQPAAGCWCRLAPVQQQQPRWRKPGGGWSSAVVPAPLRYGPGHGQSSCWCTLKEFFYFFLINCIDLKSVFHLIPQIHFYSYLSLRIITTWLKSKRDDKVWEFKWWDKKKQQLTAVATRCHCGITEVRGSAVRARSPHILLFIHGCGVRFTQQSPAVLCFLCRPGVANSFYNMEDHEYQN